MLVAIVSELKEAEVDTARKRRRDPNVKYLDDLGSEAESLRGEAANVKSTFGAASAALAVAGATLATVPQTGQIIAAIAAVIAAVVIILGQPNEQAEKDQAAAKEKESNGSAAETAERLRRVKLRLVAQMETLQDDELFAK